MPSTMGCPDLSYPDSVNHCETCYSRLYKLGLLRQGVDFCDASCQEHDWDYAV